MLPFSFSSTQHKIRSIFSLLVIIALIPLSVYLVKQQQEIRSRAAEEDKTVFLGNSKVNPVPLNFGSVSKSQTESIKYLTIEYISSSSATPKKDSSQSLVTPLGKIAKEKSVSLVLSPETFTATVGATLDAKLTLSAGSNNITGIDVTVKYDTGIVEVINLQPSSEFDNQLINKVDNSLGTLRYSSVNVTKTNLTGDINIGTITFKAKREGTSNVAFENIQITALGSTQGLITTNNTTLKYTVIPSSKNYSLSLKQPIKGATIAFSEEKFSLKIGEQKAVKVSLTIDPKTLKEDSYNNGAILTIDNQNYSIPLSFNYSIPLLNTLGMGSKSILSPSPTFSPVESIQNLTNQLLRAPKEPDISAKDTEAQLKKLKEIAQRRKEVMLKTAEEDPELFLKYTLPKKIKDSFPKDVQEFVEEEKEVRGKLTVYHLDDFQGGKSKYKYKLKEEETGNKYELHFAKPPGGLLSESQVVAKGVFIDSELVIDSVRFAGDPRGREMHGLSIESSPSLESTGEKRILVLLVNLESDRREPVSIEYVRSLFALDGLMNTFYKESSFNQLSLSADVYGWYTISNSNIEQGNEDDCAAAADSRATSQGIEVNEYEHIIYVFPSNQPCSQEGYIGLATIGGDATRAWIFAPSWEPVYLHEFGHNLGLGHAQALNCGQRQIDRFRNCSIWEYGDPSDVMGNGMNRINAPNRSVLGWLRPEEILSVPEEGGRYTISSLEASNSGIKVLRIEKPTFFQPWRQGKDYYYVSYRQATGYDINLPDSFTNGSSLHIRHEDVYQGTPSLLLDSTAGDDYMRNAGLTDSSVFSDLDGISITQESHLPNSATLSVQINPDSYTCRRGNSLVWISSEDYGAVVAPGAPLRYKVSIKNGDEGRCPETRFTLSPRFPPGNWNATFETSLLSVPPGGVRFTDLVVNSPTNVQDGVHIFFIRGTSESDPNLWVEDRNSYIVFSRERASLNVSVKIPGIGSGQRENPNPMRRERSAEVWVALNNPQAQSGGPVPLYRQADLIFDGNTFTGSLDLADIQNGSYSVRVKLDNTLVKSTADVPITGGTGNDLSMVTLVSGDLNNDNRINIQDFSILISCFGSRQCRPEIRKTLSDFNDDGKISGVDYSRLLTNFLRRGE